MGMPTLTVAMMMALVCGLPAAVSACVWGGECKAGDKNLDCCEGLSCHPGLNVCYNVPRQYEEPCTSAIPCASGLSCHLAGINKCYNTPRAMWEPCTIGGTDCAAGLYCDPALKACQAPVGAGERCSPARPCAEGLSCHPGAQVCLPLPREYGQLCNPDNPCKEGLVCELNVTNTCVVPSVEDQLCHATLPCAEGFSCHPLRQRCYHNPRRLYQPCDADNKCDAERGLFCELGASNICLKASQEYEICHPTKPCAEGLSCHPGQSTCYSVPRKQGQPCKPKGVDCEEGLFCDPLTYICTPPAAHKQQCWTSKPCGEGMSCHPGLARCYYNPRQQGEPCSATVKCAEGLVCDTNATNTCLAPGQHKEECRPSRPCGDGLSCHPGLNICLSSPRQWKEPCKLPGFPCAEGLVCDTNMTNTCLAPADHLEPCWPSRPCAPNFSCHPGLAKCFWSPRAEGEPCSSTAKCNDGMVCDTGNTNTCLRPANYKEPCWPTRPCAAGLSCHPGLKMCLSNPRMQDEPCGPGQPSCATFMGLYCDTNVTNTCKWAAGLGEGCWSTRFCAPGLTCHPVLNTCYHRYREELEPCNRNFSCASGMRCDYNQTGLCFRNALVGEPCWSTRACAASYSCHTDGRCYHNPRKLEEPCDFIGGMSCEVPALTCVAGLKYCTKARPYGASCNPPTMPCELNLSCDTNHMKCFNKPRQKGEPCSASFPCALGLKCPTSYPYCVPA